MMGKPCIKGARITVELVLEQLGAGVSIAELLEDYPRLTKEDVESALRYAADCLPKADDAIAGVSEPSQAYEDWFRAEVHRALADDRPAVSSAEVEAEFSERRAASLK